MMKRVFSVMSCLLLAAGMHDAVSPVQAVSAVAQATVDEQLAALPTITTYCPPESVVAWLTKVETIMDDLAVGGLSSLPTEALVTVGKMNTLIVKDSTRMANPSIVAKVVDMQASIWTTGFWYASEATWLSLFKDVFTTTTTACKALDESVAQTTAVGSAYDALVNETSLMIRFTKDTVFLNGVDNGEPMSAMHEVYFSALPELVATVSKSEGFQLSEQQLRDYMNTIPSKADGMDMSAPYPVYVDTAKYKDSDAAALREFLTQTPYQSKQAGRVRTHFA